MSYRCIRSFSIDAGHRVFGHESRCAHLHGHTFRIVVHAQAEELDSVGRVIDFSVLKSKIGTWLLDQWDHGFIYFHADKELDNLFQMQMRKMKSYCLPVNPTAENLATYLLNEVCPELMQGTGVKIVRVDVHETPQCYSTAVLEANG